MGSENIQQVKSSNEEKMEEVFFQNAKEKNCLDPKIDLLLASADCFFPRVSKNKCVRCEMRSKTCQKSRFLRGGNQSVTELR